MLSGREIMVIVAVLFMSMAFMVTSVAKFWFARPRAVDNKQLNEIATRLASLERAVDAIAVETERISEGQRFTTKLLSDRAPARSFNA